MALQKQIVPVSFDQGVDTHSDPKQVVMGKLLTLENGTFTSGKRIKKRNGYEDFGRDIFGSASLVSSGKGLATFKDELCLFDDTTFYSWNDAGNSWFSKGAQSSVYATQSTVIRNTYQQTAQDSAIHSSGLHCFVWEDTQGASRYSIVDSNTGLRLVANNQIDADASRPKVVCLGQYFLIFYVDSAATELNYRVISTGTPTSIGAEVLVDDDLPAAFPYDVAIIGDRCYIAWGVNTGDDISAQFIDSHLTAGAVETFSAGAADASCITVFEDSLDQNVVIGWWDGTNVQSVVYAYNLVTVVDAIQTLEAVANVVNITGAAIPGTTSSIRFFYSISAAQTYNYLVRTSLVDNYDTGTEAVFLRSVGLAGKAFAYEGTVYVPIVHSSTLQSTYFIADSSGRLVAKFLAGLGGGLPTRSQLANVNAVSDTKFQMALLSKGPLQVDAGNLFTLTGVSSAAFDFFDPANSYLSAELGNNLHLSGGFLQMYDGIGFVEHGFHLYPENVSAAAGTAGSTFSYQYQVVFAWMDNQGLVHRSAPSPILTATAANAINTGGANTMTLTIPTLRLTAKQARAPVTCEVYRTINAGSVFYLATSVSSPTLNSTSADTVTFADTVTDAALIGNSLLYTTGGVLENIAPNAIGSMTVYQRRIVGIDSTDPFSLQYSKQIEEGAPVEFTDAFRIALDQRGGKATAVSAMDDKLIVWKATSVYFMTGQGPDSTGNQNDFSTPQLITTDCGCTNPRSVVQTPMGHMFQGEKGFYLLDRGLRTSYIGLDVETYNDETVTSAQLIPDTNEVRFTLDSGVALVFDYEVGQWSVFTAIDAVDSIIYAGRYVYLKADGNIRRETPGVYSDAGNWIKLRVVSSWLSLAGLQGFQRCYRFLLLGEYASPHLLLCSVAYDFIPLPSQEVTVDAGDLLGGTTYGEDSPYGEGTPYGGDYPRYQFRLHLTKQKCEAIQLTLEDAPSGTEIGEGMSLSAFTLEVGAKRGAFKLPAARSIA